MKKRDVAILLRLVQLATILAVLIIGVGALAESSGGGSMLGMPNRLFFGAIGMVLVIYVALSFSKFMFKNLPSEEEGASAKDDVPDGASWKAAGRVAEMKYGERKKQKSDIDKYYAVGKR